MLVLREHDIISLLKNLTRRELHEFLAILTRALQDYSTGNNGQDQLIHQPLREQITTAKKNTTLFMPASDTVQTTGIKVVTLPGGGGAPGGAINLFAPNGTLEGVLNAEEITAFRTALASMVPFERHHRNGCFPQQANVVVFGAGKQAEWHVRLALLLAHENIARITVVNRQGPTLDSLRARLAAEIAPMFPQVQFAYCSRGHPDHVSSANRRDEEAKTIEEEGEGEVRSAVAQADAIFCCTPSTGPLFPDSYLHTTTSGGRGPDRRFISLIGSYKPHMQEVEGETLLSGGKILVDSKAACLAESGDLIKAGVQAEKLVEVGELVPGTADEPRPGENTVFKCVGLGIMDLVVGRQLLQTARSRAVGVAIGDF